MARALWWLSRICFFAWGIMLTAKAYPTASETDFQRGTLAACLLILALFGDAMQHQK